MNFKNKIKEILDCGKTLDIPESLIRYVVDNPKFALWSGSSKAGQHHYGTGGLQFHTWEVVSCCILNGSISQNIGHKIDERTLFLSALYHDVGKMWDYEPYGTKEDPEPLHNTISIKGWSVWKSAEHKRTIHHISRSAIEWSKAVDKTGECKDIEDKVLHCILSHHCTRDWGSPVAPLTREAWLLFLCDGISARTTDCETSDMLGRVKSV